MSLFPDFEAMIDRFVEEHRQFLSIYSNSNGLECSRAVNKTVIWSYKTVIWSYEIRFPADISRPARVGLFGLRSHDRSRCGGAPPILPRGTRKVDVRLPGKGNSNSHGARPVHLIITMIQWIRTSRLSIKNSLSPR